MWRTSRQLYATALSLAIGGILQTPSHAADWDSTSLWYLHGRAFELGDRKRDILRFEHANIWKYGDNYYFFDVVDSETTGTTMYGEFAPRISLGKLSGHDMAFGPVRDVLVTAAINIGSSNFRADLYGVGIDLKVPGFTYFQLNAYVRDDQNQPGSTWQITPIWLHQFNLGSLKFSLQGFIDYAGTEGTAVRNLLAAPRLWLDLGALWDAPMHVEVGVEYLYWRNKYGVKGVTEAVLQPSLRWTF